MKYVWFYIDFIKLKDFIRILNFLELCKKKWIGKYSLYLNILKTKNKVAIQNIIDDARIYECTI